MTTSPSKLVTIADTIKNLQQQLTATSTNLSMQAQDIKSNIQTTDIVLNLIRDVVSQTHLLGVNAAIEATWAGDTGKGFNVVAEEIEKLTNRTNSSIIGVTQTLKMIKHTVSDLTEQIYQITAVSKQQTASVEEISG